MGNWIKLSKKEKEGLLALPDLDDKVRKRIERANTKITTRSAKQKGLEFQKWIAKQIAELIDEEFGMDDEALVSSRPGGQHGVDIILRGEAKKKFPFSVEAKNQETLNLPATIEQASQNILSDTDWLIVHKQKRITKPIAILEWDVFVNLCKKGLDKNT